MQWKRITRRFILSLLNSKRDSSVLESIRRLETIFNRNTANPKLAAFLPIVEKVNEWKGKGINNQNKRIFCFIVCQDELVP